MSAEVVRLAAPDQYFGGAKVHSRALFGLDAHAVQVECHVTSGLPGTTVVGLPQGSVREARDRVRSAIEHLGFSYPDTSVVFNLAPAQISKAGTSLDLPMAISLLVASGQLPQAGLHQFEFVGELGLFGELRPIPGVVACVLAAQQMDRNIVLPQGNQQEAMLLQTGNTHLASDLGAVTELLSHGQLPAAPAQPPAQMPAQPAIPNQIVGQPAAKRALAVAAAGGHHLLMIGPPGTGKTLLAQNLRCLLPAMTRQQVIDVAGIYSASGLSRNNYQAPPFRAPHHSASSAALIGGGNPPTPGELVLAHHGVLFLDELPHFKPSALNLMREPLESGRAEISRASYKVSYPCRFQLIAAMNPCPAGRSCREHACRCDPLTVRRYQSRISGPILDRIDLHVRVAELDAKVLVQLRDDAPTDWDVLRQQVGHAQAIAKKRQQHLNVFLSTKQVQQQMARADVDQSFLDRAIQRYQLSARSYHKLWRIARTIADLECASGGLDEPQPIQQAHLAEALSYRALDWEAGV